MSKPMNANNNDTLRGKISGRIKSSIAAKLALAMTLAAILPLALAWALTSYFNGGSADQGGRLAQESALRAADVVAHTLAENVRLLQTLAISNEIRSHLGASNSMYSGSRQSINSTIGELNKQWTSASSGGAGNDALIREITSNKPAVNQSGYLLHKFKEQFPQHLELLLTDKYGANLAATGVTSRYAHADEPWWQQAYQGGAGAVYIGKPGSDANAGSIVLAAPVVSGPKQVIGVLRSTFGEREIKEALGAIKPGKGGRVYIADADGAILFDSSKQTVAAGQKLPGALAGFVKRERPGFSHQGEIVGYAKPSRSFGVPEIDKLQWVTIAAYEPGEASSSWWSPLLLPLLLAGLAISFALILGIALSRGFITQINHVGKLLKQIRAGRIQSPAEVVSADELGRMTDDLNSVIGETFGQPQTMGEREELRDSLMELLVEVSRVADGDLTVEAAVRPDLTGDMARAFNRMISELRRIIGRVQDVTLQVESSANETQATTERLAQDSEKHARQMIAAREVIGGMTATIRQVVETADTSKDVAQKSLSTAKQGAEAVQNSIKGMSSLREQVQETTKRIKRLGENSQEIGEIVKLIGDIAYRTSVLALNASIQAARAGEAGRGFAVVAEEVERLSKRSTEAAKRIADLVKTIQAGTNEAIAAMEESTREVVEGSNLVYEAGSALSEIEEVSTRLAELIQSISGATERQAQDSEVVFKTMVEISEATQQTTSGIKRSASSVNQLAALADSLRASVASFRLSDDYANGQGNGHRHARN
ncbi:MAG: methyl-accepting chemotaxis protein [Blastocatellia bacterium]